VGIAMTKFTEGEEKERVEVNLSDLKTGQIISAWLNQNITDRKVAEFISIK
jgi:hypothetical protein